MNNSRAVRAGLLAALTCYCLWGLQPLYWHLDGTFDSVFLMASRAVAAALFCLILLAVQGKLGQLKAVFTDPRLLAREIPASLFLFGDWFVFIWAVQHRQVLECSVGYYIQPLVVFAFGALLFHEKCSAYHFAALGFVLAGIVVSALALGSLPWVTVSLALMFAVYAAIKKSLTIDSVVSTSCEILIMAPFLLAYLLIFRRGPGGLAEIDLPRALFLLGGGVITGLPILLYSVGVKRLRLITVSIGQYVSPTLGVLCSLILREEITREKLISLALIWAGILIYLFFTIRELKTAKERTGEA
jgi:chloramphenicol-sensitive protein RarD